MTVQPLGGYPNCATCPIDEFKEQWERRRMVVEQSRLRQLSPDTHEQDIQVAYLLSLRLQLLHDLNKRRTNSNVQARPAGFGSARQMLHLAIHGAQRAAVPSSNDLRQRAAVANQRA